MAFSSLCWEKAGLYEVGKKQERILHMGYSRRLTDQERRQIVRERAKGVLVRAISTTLKVSPKTVYNVLSHGRSAVSALPGPAPAASKRQFCFAERATI